MPDEKQNPNAGKQPFTLVKTPEYRRFYANNVSFATGVFDFNLTFGHIVEVDNARETGTIEQKATVSMSPLHAKLFAVMFSQQIKGYEATFGEIRIPANIIDNPPTPEQQIILQSGPEEPTLPKKG